MSENWVVGETYGDFELIAINPKTATFRKPDGTEVTYPNVFQDHATRGVIIPERTEKTKQPKKTSTVSDLDKIIAAAQAKKEALAALK